MQRGFLYRFAGFASIAAGAIACKRPAQPALGLDAGVAQIATTDDASTIAQEEAPSDAGPTPSGPAADAATADERKRVVTNLLSGAYRASDLPESSTDTGRPFDRGLRKRLTEVEVPAAGPNDDDPLVPRPPRGEVQIQPATPSVPIDNLDRVVAGLRPRFRQCYQTLVSADPSAAGKLVVEFVVALDGTVSVAKVTTNAGLSETTAACVAGVIRRAQFEAPKAPSTVTLKLSFAIPKE